MTESNFRFIKQLIYQSTGIVLGERKKIMVYARLSRRLRFLKLNNFDQYCDYLQRNKAIEMSQFINAITTNLTSFFRENHHYEFLQKKVISELLNNRHQNKRLRVWSAGCSTGEEPYSIAMIMAPLFNKNNDWDLKILATDLDSNVLAKAKAGIYPAKLVDAIPEALKKSSFVRSETRQQYKIKPHLKAYIHFKHLNLLDAWPMQGQFDIVFCRNVIIYFDDETKNNLVKRFIQLLKPGGYLFLGHSETISREITELEPLGQTIYRRKPFDSNRD